MAVTVESRVRCAADLEALFDVVGDTDRLNRESGLPEIVFRSEDDGRKIVRSPLGPLTLEYAEHPWEWVRPERIHVRREYKNGPLTTLDVHFTFASDGSKNEVAVRLDARPRPLMGPLMKVILTAIAAKLGRAIERIDRELTGKAEPLKLIEVSRAELARAEKELSLLVAASDRAIAERLVRHVADAPDHEVVRIRPYELAARWGGDRRRTLEICLHAVVAGLLELEWDLICPSCRTAAVRVPTLADVEAHGHCKLCDLGFGLALDQAIEATFIPARSVRRVREQQFCTGGPAVTPHVIAQASLHPGTSIELRAPEEEARYRLFVRGGVTVPIDLGADRPSEVTARIGERVDPPSLAVRPGGRILLNGEAGTEGRHVKLERMDWSSIAATAQAVTMLPAFRRRFSEQILRPGLALKVGRVALLFSDLSASTALYTREGDAAAFGLVQDHFELLRGCIEENEGVIVKTIGDAVMAAFIDEASSIRAAIAMQRAFPAFRDAQPCSEGVYLKIGVHAGACYVVTANGALDYFGQTVNVAARLQAQAGDAEIVMTEECASRASDLLAGLEVDPPFAAKLKGVDPEIRAVRMRVRSRS
jgi:class 3 adenylate cyclase